MSEIKTCTKCVMTEKYPGIEFDESGVCSICRKEKKDVKIDWVSRKAELDKIIYQAKKSSSKYQVIVPFSGGKDSTYTLYIMKKTYDLDVLAVNYDNGFKSELAHKNIENICSNLGVDLVIIKPNWHLMKKLYKHYLYTTGEFCSVCNNMGYIMVMSYIAKEKKYLGYSPLMVGGWAGDAEEMRSIFTFDFAQFRSEISKDKDLYKFFENYSMFDKKIYNFLSDVGDPRVTVDYDKHENSLNYVQLPEYIEWDMVKIKALLKKELDWECSDHPTAAHEDCIASPVFKYLMQKKWGITQEAITLSDVVRKNSMTRDEALATIEKYDRNNKPSFWYPFLNMIEADEEKINYDGDWYTGDNVKNM